jgi:peptidoglycan/xylan/chitin deacetylase (PgdA/CDA1 family)
MVPAGTNTSSIPRDLLGSVLYGSAGIYDCVNPGDMALTFDDGPFIYTSHILDLLGQYNASATFFITGNNNGKSYFKVPVVLEIIDTEVRQRTNR